MRVKFVLDFVVSQVRDPLLVKFLIIGGSAAGFILLFTGIFTSYLGFKPYLSALISVELSNIWGFFVLDYLVFRKFNKKHGLLLRFCIYHVVSVGALLFNEAVLVFLTNQIKMYYLLAEFFGIMAGFSINYTMQRRFSWARAILR